MTLTLSEGRSTKSLSDQEVKQLFEDLFLHYRKDFIKEEEMLSFFGKRGINIEDSKELVFLMYHAERVLKWVVASKDSNWKPAIFARFPEDLEEFLEEHKG